jgi:hypothetical protein
MGKTWATAKANNDTRDLKEAKALLEELGLTETGRPYVATLPTRAARS